MAWIESHTGLRNHPKTKKLARLLGVSVPSIIGHLHCLWWWAVEYADDGDLSEFDWDEIADAAGWTEDPAKFIECMHEVRFLDIDSSDHYPYTYRIHDWDEYAGKLIDRRQRNAERKRMSRGRPQDITETSLARPQDVPLTSVATQHNTTVPNTTIPNLTKPNTHNSDTQEIVDTLETSHNEAAATSESDRVCVDNGEIEQPEVIKHFCLTFNKGKPSAQLIPLQKLIDQYGPGAVYRQIDVVKGVPDLRNPIAALTTACRDNWTDDWVPQSRASPHDGEVDLRYENFYKLYPELRQG